VQALLIFSYLQILDGMSTVVFLMLGIREANPLVKFTLSVASNPIAGLLLVKVAAVLTAVYCWRVGRTRALRLANCIFALLVAWNLVAVMVRVAQLV